MHNNEDFPVSVKRPIKIRILQYASLVLAVAGLVFLYLFSVNRDLPFVRIGNITPTMNFAYVRIAGEVTRDGSVFQSGGIGFSVNDGSGDISVMGGRVQAKVLEAAGKLPRRGDRIEVAGSLSISADQDATLRMQSADQLVLNRKRPAAIPSADSRTPLANVTVAQQGRTVAVAGILKSIDVPGPGVRAPYVFTLEENGAELAVIFWDDVFQGLDKKLPMPGKFISACGRVDVYKNVIQLKVQAVGDLRIIEEAGK